MPLRALERIRDKQQICVGVVVENPCTVERQTPNLESQRVGSSASANVDDWFGGVLGGAVGATNG